jgi:trehalose 6-phosphate phosphatase
MIKLTATLLENELAAAEQVLVAVDFDGTLCRIAPRPELVFLPEATRETLIKLSIAPGVAVAIVSGRRLEDVEQRVGLPLIYAGNHGFEIRGLGFSFEHPDALANIDLLEHACVELERAISGWQGAWVERKRITATVHFRNVAADEQHQVAMAVRRTLCSFGTVFALRAGKQALEVRPKVEWHKGAAVDYIRRQIQFEDATCVLIGDDVTDETMFRSLPDHISIRVGWHSGSAARFYVDDVAEVQQMLERVVEWTPSALTHQTVA